MPQQHRQSKVVKDSGKRAPESRPVFTEHGTLELDTEFFISLAMAFALRICQDPKVSLQGEPANAHTVAFTDFSQMVPTIHKCFQHWLTNMLRYEPLHIPIPKPIYALFQPLLHPRVQTVNGIHKINVTVDVDPSPIDKNELQQLNSLFGRDGYFQATKGWTSYTELDYLDRQKDYMPIHYTTQQNTQKPSRGPVQFLKRRVDPRRAGLVRLDSTVVGQVTSTLGVNETMCLRTHVRLLQAITLSGTTIKSLDRSTIPRVRVVSQPISATCCAEMVFQGTHEGLLGLTGVQTHTMPPFYPDSTTLTTCKALEKLPNGAVPGELMEPPDPSIWVTLAFIARMVKNPSSYIEQVAGDSQKRNSVLKAVASFCRACVGQSLVPQIFSETLTHARTTVFPFNEAAGVETGFVLSLFILPREVFVAGEKESISQPFTGSIDDDDDRIRQGFQALSYVQKFCLAMGNTMTSSPLVSGDSTGGLFSVRTLLYRLEQTSDTGSLKTIGPDQDDSAPVDSAISEDAYQALKGALKTSGELDVQVPTLKLLQPSESGSVNNGFFKVITGTNDTFKLIVHPVDKDLGFSRSLITHIPNFDYAHARHIAGSYNLPVASEEDGVYRAATVEDKNNHTANGYRVLTLSCQREDDTIPTSTINNPNGDNHASIVQVMNQIAIYGGIGDFFKTIGNALKPVGKAVIGGLASAIPVVGPALGQAAGGLIDSL